jgi:hypothetical protein
MNMRAVWLVALGGLSSASACSNEDPSPPSTTAEDPPPGGVGAVSVYSYGPPKDAVSIAAGFHRNSGAKEVCTSETVGTAGECVVRTCTNVETQGPGALTGPITVTVGPRALTVVPTGPGIYAPPADNTPALFAGGETITFTVAPAGDVPAHGATVVAPTPLVLTKPEPTATIHATRSTDLELAWTGGAAGELLFVTGIEGSDGGVVALTCRFPAAPGGAVLAADVLARLPPTVAPAPTFFWVMSRTEIDAGPWHTAFSALGEVLGPTGSPVSTQLVLE